MKIAALDLGSNSFLCLIVEVENGKIVKVVRDLVKVVRLGQQVLQTQMFHEEALQRAEICLTEFKKAIDDEGNVQKVLAYATAAARDVKNNHRLFEIGKKLGIEIQIIEGTKEAEVTYKGAISGLSNDTKIGVIDVGGGSTELILGQNGKIICSESVNIGCVKLKEKFLNNQPLPLENIEKIMTEIKPLFLSITEKINSYKIDEMVAVAGTPTAIAALEFGQFIPEKVDGFKLSKESILKRISEFASKSPQQISDQYGLEIGRADIILAGCILLYIPMELLSLKEFTVSVRGVRFGLALEMAKNV